MNSRQVPVFDIRALPDDVATLRELDGACRDWGFFQIAGHGIPASQLAAAYAQMQAFFALPDSDKQAVARTATNTWGYYDRELTKNRRDWKQIFDVGPAIEEGPLAGTRPQWPTSLPQFRPAILALAAAFETVAYRVMQGIAINLGIQPAHLFAAFGARHTSFLRLNYYPICDDPAPPDSPTVPTSGHLAINHHTDSGALTVLLQDSQPGLQVLQGDSWHLVEPRPDALVINIGDVVQVWSNDLYVAPVHRVIGSRTKERYSAPFFLNPSPETNYAPLPSMCKVLSPRYHPINWGEFRAGRAAGDYADLGAEIQISDFRVESL
jgi:isopenicillin N synthase-like dioxygenase